MWIFDALRVFLLFCENCVSPHITGFFCMWVEIHKNNKLKRWFKVGDFQKCLKLGVHLEVEGAGHPKTSSFTICFEHAWVLPIFYEMQDIREILEISQIDLKPLKVVKVMQMVFFSEKWFSENDFRKILKITTRIMSILEKKDLGRTLENLSRGPTTRTRGLSDNFFVSRLL